MKFTLNVPPDGEDYEKVLEQLYLSEKLSGKHLRILQAQYNQEDHEISAPVLSSILNYKSYSGANSAYGNLSKLIALNLQFETKSPKETKSHWWRALSNGNNKGKYFNWTLRKEVVQALENLALVDTTETNIPDLDLENFNYSGFEGRKKLLFHLKRERNQKLIKLKKESSATLNCEICGFSFKNKYGTIAEKICEAHHIIPLETYTEETETKLEDLVLLCSNCHRVVHLKNPPYSLNEIKEIIRSTTGCTRTPQTARVR